MKPFQYTLVVLAALIAAASSRTSVLHPSPADSFRATDGAYRDGLFIGHLDRSQGQRHHLASGRWSTSADRQSFAAGYEDGYAQPARN